MSVELKRRIRLLQTLPGFSELEVGPRQWWDFETARAFARTLGLKSRHHWTRWRKTPARPRQLHTHPGDYYKKEWRGYADFLGTGNPPTKQW